MMRNYNTWYLTGDLQAVGNLVDRFKESKGKLGDVTLESAVDYLEAEYLYLTRSINSSRGILNNLVSQLGEVKNRKLIADYHLLSAKIGYLEEDIPMTIFELQEALLYLDPINFPSEVADIYLNLGKAYTHIMEFGTSDLYFQKARLLLNKHPDKYVESVYFFEVGVASYLHKDYKKAAEFNQKSFKMMQKLSNNPDDLYRMHNINARLLYQIGDKNSAAREFERTLKLETKLSDNTKVFSSVIGFNELLHSEDNFQKSDSKIRHMLEITPPNLRSSLRKYLSSSYRYLFSPSKKTQEKGRNDLRELSDKANYKLLRTASSQTLLTGEIQPIR